MAFLERDDCLRELAAGLSDALAGRGGVALVSGEAGIGKTTLVRHFVKQRAAAVRVVWGTCDAQFTPRPLGPLYEMAAELRGSVSRLLADGSDRTRLFAAVLAELGARPTIGCSRISTGPTKRRST